MLLSSVRYFNYKLLENFGFLFLVVLSTPLFHTIFLFSQTYIPVIYLLSTLIVQKQDLKR